VILIGPIILVFVPALSQRPARVGLA